RLETISNAIPDGFRPRSSRTSKTIVVPRRLVPDKQVDHAITAFGKAVIEHPDWKLRIFGDGPLTGRMRRLVEELGLHDSVEIMGPTRHMTDEWAKAAFTVLPSETEGFGLVLVEAFAAGVPAVAYDVPTGPAEIIRHGVDGLLVEAADTEALAAAMARLMADEALLHRMGAAALEGATRFSAARINKTWERLFAELYATRRDPARLTARADRAGHRKAVTAGGGFQPSAPASKISPSAGGQRAREDELLAGDASLVRSAGQLAYVRDDLPAARAYEENLRLAADALEAADIPYVLLRDRDDSPHRRLAVDAALQADVRAALARAYPGQAVYAELLGPVTDAPGAVLAERLGGVGEVRGLRVCRPYLTSGRTLRYGPAFGCDIEFWPYDELLGGYTAPRRPAALGPTLRTVVPNAVTRVRDRAYPTLEDFNEPLVTDLDFPVDAVYTWVDDADPEWQERLNARRAELGLPPKPQAEVAGDASVRFRNRDELRYSLRSLAMYAPWIRTIYLVTDGQRPSWLKAEHPGLKIVDHRALWDDPAALPVFNSHAIESRLHHIEDLSEHFLYLNDDFFLGRPVAPNRFFRSNGNSRFFWSPTAIPAGEATPTDEGYFAAAKNNRRLLKDRFGVTVTHGFLHAPYPLRRSVLSRITEEFAEPLARTSRSALRDWRDVSLVSSLHHHYGYLTGTAEPGGIRCGYVDTGRYEQQHLLTRLLANRAKDVFCLGEGAESEVPETEQAQVMRAFLEAYFPVKGPYERSSGVSE
ncbi:glycosyltransferase, partial [Streptomyces sp. A7024]